MEFGLFHRQMVGTMPEAAQEPAANPGPRKVLPLFESGASRRARKAIRWAPAPSPERRFAFAEFAYQAI